MKISFLMFTIICFFLFPLTKQKVADAHTSSGKSSKKSWSFLPTFPCCRDKRRSAKVAPVPATKCKRPLRAGDGVPPPKIQELILYDLEEYEHSFTGQTKRPPCPKVTQGTLELQKKLNGCEMIQEKPAHDKSEENKMTNNNIHGMKVCYPLLPTQPYSMEGKLGRPYKRRAIKKCRGHGDSRPSPGFLLHGTRPSREASPIARRGRQTSREKKESDISQQTSDKRYSWTSESSQDNTQQKTDYCDEENKLPKLTKSVKENSSTPTEHRVQEAVYSEPEKLDIKSSTVTSEWFTENPRKNDRPKVDRPCTRQGRTMDENNHAEELVSLSHGKYSDELIDSHLVNSPGKFLTLGELGNSYSHPEEKDIAVDMWKNDFEEIENIVETLMEGYEKKNSIFDDNQMNAYFSKEEQALLESKIEEISRSPDSPTISNDLCEYTEKIPEGEEYENSQSHDYQSQSLLSKEEEAPLKSKSEENSRSPRNSSVQETAEELNERQKEQWELAALGEWSLICHDDEDDEELTNSFLSKDEFEKEQEIRINLKSILAQYQDLHVIQDFQEMLNLPGCPRQQIEWALRQYAHICRGPVPLSTSGQTKAEAVASLSVNLRRQTKRFVQDPHCSFREFPRVVEELDILRERQDTLEESLIRDLRKEEERIRMVQNPRRRRRRRKVDLKQPQWKLDRRMVSIYMCERKVKSKSLIDVMKTILELSEDRPIDDDDDEASY